jgi:hypothetical protein
MRPSNHDSGDIGRRTTSSLPCPICCSISSGTHSKSGVMTAIALFMGGGSAPSRAIAQSAGYAFRLAAQRIKDEFHCSGELQLLLLRYTQALLTQLAQTAVCNRHHSVDQQLCRGLRLSLG